MKVFFLSLGCDKNRVDSEKVLALFLKKYKATIVDNPESADIAIVNTCSFINDAKRESKEWIEYLVSLKKKKIIRKILMLGCLATEIKRVNEKSGLFDDVDCILPLENYSESLDFINDRMHDVLSFSSFLKICDGCDKFCSYCIIPFLRGRFRSNSECSLLAETKKLAKAGVKELSIVGQDTLSYGVDIDRNGKSLFTNLINSISKVHGIEWIRLLYCYPEMIDDRVISLIKNNKKVLHYIDMPIQHASDKILKSMGRFASKEGLKLIIDKLRKEIPDICIRTTIMVGFPGENDDDFDELIDFIKEIRFDKLGVFCYSDEKLARSYRFSDKVDEKTKLYRKQKVLETQKKIVGSINKEKVGNVYKAIVEGYDTKKKMYVVRPYFDARDIDDKVYVKAKNLISGSFIKIKIVKAIGQDLLGEICE